MNIQYYYFLISILLPRVILQWKDDSISTLKSLSAAFIAELLLLSPLFSLKNSIIIIPLLLIYHGFQYVLQRDGINLLPKRILELFFLIFTSSFVFGFLLPGITFNASVIRIIKTVYEHNALFPTITQATVKKIIIYSTGIILLINEINNIIRYILNLLKTEPQFQNNDKYFPDTSELYRGKMIGVIERILFYFFVITNNYASIAFILTAKGLTRFKELDDKDFAEYVLIGTLLSSGMAILCAVLIIKMIRITG